MLVRRLAPGEDGRAVKKIVPTFERLHCLCATHNPFASSSSPTGAGGSGRGARQNRRAVAARGFLVGAEGRGDADEIENDSLRARLRHFLAHIRTGGAAQGRPFALRFADSAAVDSSSCCPISRRCSSSSSSSSLRCCRSARLLSPQEEPLFTLQIVKKVLLCLPPLPLLVR